MLELRELDLQLAFARAGSLRENVENQRRAVEDLALERLLQVAACLLYTSPSPRDH
jgi:hypothetical protein